MNDHEPTPGGAGPGPEDWQSLRFTLRESTHRPPVGEIVQRAAVRRREKIRRNVGVGLTAAVIAGIPITAALVGPPAAPSTGSAAGSTARQTGAANNTFGSTAPTPSPPLENSRSSATSIRITVLPPTTTDLPPQPLTIWDAQFADADHGYALLDRCSATSCVTRLAVTSDGRHWSERSTPYSPPPPADGADTADIKLVVLGPDRVVIRTDVGTHRAWLTTDAGKTWKSAAAETSVQAGAQIPSFSQLEDICTDTFGSCSSPLAVRTPTGALLNLAGAPTDNVVALHQVTANGIWLLWGLDQPQGQGLTTFRTTNGGQSWTKVNSQLIAEPIFSIQLSQDGSNLVATVIGQLPDVKNGLVTMLSSADDGGTWKTTWRARATTQPRSSLGTPVLAVDGALTVATESQICYRSDDVGRTFTTTPNCVANAWVEQRHGVYVRLDGSTVQSSADGTHWTTYRP